MDSYTVTLIAIFLGCKLYCDIYVHSGNQQFLNCKSYKITYCNIYTALTKSVLLKGLAFKSKVRSIKISMEKVWNGQANWLINQIK